MKIQVYKLFTNLRIVNTNLDLKGNKTACRKFLYDINRPFFTRTKNETCFIYMNKKLIYLYFFDI